MQVQLSYFAVLRDQRGLSSETVTTEAPTYRALYESLAAEHGFTLPPSLVSVAVNGIFGAMDDSVQEGDQIVFIPPVAGG